MPKQYKYEYNSHYNDKPDYYTFHVALMRENAITIGCRWHMKSKRAAFRLANQWCKDFPDSSIFVYVIAHFGTNGTATIGSYEFQIMSRSDSDEANQA